MAAREDVLQKATKPMEIERQFLIETLPSLPTQYDTIRQGYVALLPEIRIRQIGNEHFTLTVKRGAGLIREAGAKRRITLLRPH